MQEKNKNKESKDALSAVIDFIPDSAIVINSAGKIVAVNKIAEKYIGYRRKEILGKPFQNFLEQQYIMPLEENIKKRLTGANIPLYEINFTDKDGVSRCLEVKGNRIKHNGQLLDLIIFHDVTVRSKIQNKLQQDLLASEEKFQGITNSVRDAIILVDEEAKVTYWNPAAQKIFGFTSEEVIGKNIHELVVPKNLRKEAKERIDSSVKVFTETGTGYFTVGKVEVVGRRKDGSEFPAEMSLSPIMLAGKWNAVGLVKDITDRKRGEAKISDAEQRYHTLFNQAPLGVSVIEPDTGKFVEFNDVAHLQLGYSREEFRELTIADIEATETPENVKSHIAEILKLGGAEFETKHRTKSGDIRNTLVTTRTIELPDKILLTSIFTDITEYRKVQNALMESEARYRQLVELAQAGIWALNNDFNTVFVNSRIAEMLGYPESEILGKNIMDFIEPSKVEKIRAIKRRFSQDVLRETFEYVFTRKDGTHINTSLAISTITNDQGQPIGALVFVTDITERKRLEDQLARYSQKLEELVEQRTEQLKRTQAKLVKSERLAAIGELAGMVGHDLRNPLTGIKNSVYFLKKKGNAISEVQAKEMLEIIDKCVDYSNKIVNDLLDYSREIHLELQEYSPQTLMSEALSMVDVPEKVEIINYLPNQPKLNVDPDKIKRVFINLVKNGSRSNA